MTGGGCEIGGKGVRRGLGKDLCAVDVFYVNV